MLGGLSRVRAMTLNDGHVFVSPGQIADEVAAMLALIDQAYDALGITGHHRRLSLHGPHGSYVDDPSMWRRAEDTLREVLDSAGVEWVSAPDEAAFYGPKIDVQVHDAQGREQTLSTVQVDYYLPTVFDLVFRNSTGDRERPGPHPPFGDLDHGAARRVPRREVRGSVSRLARTGAARGPPSRRRACRCGLDSARSGRSA